MNVLVTGGAGYIGSHACKRLLADGHTVVSVDNLFRGHREAMDALTPLAKGRLTFVPADVGDRELMTRLLLDHRITTVMHFAALAYVGESMEQPLRYYRNNTAAALSLIEACQVAGESGGGVERFVFSSTCATYGEPGPGNIPIAETCPQVPINPYGWSKLHTERMLCDYAEFVQSGRGGGKGGKPFALARLRYFNVAGSDRDGIIGEHHEPETHLIPVCLQVALGPREALTIHGADYPTRDGTCIRDYVHVEDLVDAHVTVMDALKPGDNRFYNLGIGRGYSNREIVEAVRRVTGKNFPVHDGPRRPGDPPELYADPRKIKAELGWSAKITDLDEIVGTAWRWFCEHPRGYAR